MSAKRKSYAGGVSGIEVDDRDAKRRRVSSIGGDAGDNPFHETARGTTESGLRLLETIRKVEDKTGRVVATNFLSLPSRRDLPDYYQVIKMPIALDTIDAKLRRNEFPTLTALEGYFKRMIQNAKEYNEKGSEIYNDAERLRKSLSNFMTKNNPGYRTTGFKVEPAPIVQDVESGNADVVDDTAAQRKSTRLPKGGNPGRSSMTPARSGAPDQIGFRGLTFQQAQEKIIKDLIDYKEDSKDDYTMFEVFVDLPSRELKDYYRVILNPMALTKLQQLVKGSNGLSQFKTWAAFEEKASYIWKNAWHYNEDGSEISILAKELEASASFKKLLKEAKDVVPEPVGTKIKLKVPEAPKITLKLGPSKTPAADSPAVQTPEPNPKGLPVNDSTRRNPFVGSQFAPTPLPILDPLERTRSSSDPAPSPTPSASAHIKHEDGARNSPALNSGYANTRAINPIVAAPSVNGSGMLPPPASNVPASNGYMNGGYAQSFNHHSQYHPPNPVLESKWRQPDKDASHALITNLSLATHPTLNISRHLRMDLAPSPTMTHQSITINLPHTHFSLQIKPTIAASLVNRQYKLFVTAGTQRLHAVPTIPGHGVDPRHPLFETRLTPGVNRIEVEVVAAPLGGSTKTGTGQDIEIEKVTIFANLMKA